MLFDISMKLTAEEVTLLLKLLAENIKSPHATAVFHNLTTAWIDASNKRLDTTRITATGYIAEGDGGPNMRYRLPGTMHLPMPL